LKLILGLKNTVVLNKMIGRVCLKHNCLKNKNE